MILAAGLGTRLQPLTDVRAKPAIPLAGVPMVRRLARWLAAAGVTDVVVNLHHRPETIAAVLGDGSDLSVRARYVWEQPLILGAAGGPAHALPIVGAGTFVLVNGDVLTTVDLAALVRDHESSGARVTLALVPNRAPHRYSGVRLDAGGRVVGYARRGDAQGSYHFVGPQVVEAEVFRTVPSGQPARSIGGVYDDLIAREPGAIRGFVSDAAYWDVGSVADYWSASWALIDGGADEARPYGSGVRVDPSARVTRSILWDDIDVARAAVLDECIVTDGVRVAAGAAFRRSILRRAAGGGVIAAPLSYDAD